MAPFLVRDGLAAYLLIKLPHGIGQDYVFWPHKVLKENMLCAACYSGKAHIEHSRGKGSVWLKVDGWQAGSLCSVVAQRIGRSAGKGVEAVFGAYFFELAVDGYIVIDGVIFSVEKQKFPVFKQLNHQIFSAVNFVYKSISIDANRSVTEAAVIIFFVFTPNFTPVCANVGIAADNCKTVLFL